MELTPRLSFYLYCHLLAFASSLFGGEVTWPKSSVNVKQIPQVSRLLLGECSVNQPFRGTLSLSNGTESTWTIRKIDTDCGCLSVVANHRRFSAGQTIQMEVQLAATKKSATVRRSVRVFFRETDQPLVLNLDLAVVGPIQLDRSVFDVMPGRQQLEVAGKKTQLGLKVDRLISGRGGFLVDGEIEQDEDSFRCVIKPLHEFGTFSDIVRVRFSDQNDRSQIIEIPVELRSVAKVRFLPSSVQLQRHADRWVGETRMVLSPEVEPVDLQSLRFVFSDSESKAGAERGKGKIHPLSSVLSIVQVTVMDDGQRVMPHFVEIEDRNGSLLGKLHLSQQGQENDKN